MASFQPCDTMSVIIGITDSALAKAQDMPWPVKGSIYPIASPIKKVRWADTREERLVKLGVASH